MEWLIGIGSLVGRVIDLNLGRRYATALDGAFCCQLLRCYDNLERYKLFCNICNFDVKSNNRWLRRSGTKLKCERKSAPRMFVEVLAITKLKLKFF